MREFKEGDSLADDEFLLKIRNDKTGYLTKFNQDGSIPKPFSSWGQYKYGNTPKDALTTYVFKETFRPGWRINGYRFGKSQNWAEMVHPEGFTVEIYLTNLLEIIQDNKIEFGKIIGFFKWQGHNLIKEESNKINL